MARKNEPSGLRTRAAAAEPAPADALEAEAADDDAVPEPDEESAQTGPQWWSKAAKARFAEFIGIRDRTEQTGVESYAHRTLLAYIGGRIWLDNPITGVGWQASSEEWAYRPFLEDARARFPSEPEQAFPAPDRPWGIQLLYLQVAADLGIAGVAALLALGVTGIVAGIRGARSSRVPLVGLAWLLVAVGVWAGIGLVPGLPLGALTWIAFGLVPTRD